MVDGWLLLTQTPDDVGQRRGRSGARASLSLTSTGVEHVCLPPTVLDQLRVAEGDALLLAAVPNAGTLLATNADQLIHYAPTVVRRALNTHHGDTDGHT